jgi:divalent metal cation (Fe/Co/Zn/Cd) transporter
MAEPAACSSHPRSARGVAWLQGVTLAWMLAECGVSLYGAISAHSPALLSFGADSFVELLSAIAVLLAILPSFPLTQARAARLAGILLFVLAGIVALVTVLSLLYRVRPETSCSGIAITFAALIVMPILAWQSVEPPNGQTTEPWLRMRYSLPPVPILRR